MIELTDPKIQKYLTPYRYEKPVLHGSGMLDAFDEKAVDIPFVFWHQNKYYMLYTGFDGKGYQSALATSDDLLHWEKVREPILSFGPEGTYYSGHVHKASIVKKDDTLYHFYCATCPWKEGDPTSAYGEYRTICVAANKKF